MPIALRAACLTVLTALPSVAFAQAPEPSGAERNVLSRLIDVTCVDIIAAAPGCEMAVLLGSESLDQMADLHIRTSDGESVAFAIDFVFSGPFMGQRPLLEAGAGGTLLVHSEQVAYGRTPWMETQTVAEHDGALRVVGYHRSMYDRPSGGDFSCTVDLVTGAWQARALRVNTETGEETQSWNDTGFGPINPTEITWWSYREPPAHCDAVMAEWFAAAP